MFTWSSGGSISVYIDGVLDTLSHTAPVLAGTITGVTNFTIGRGAKTTDSKGWQGYIDDVRLYSRPLTQAEITTLASGATRPSLTYNVRLSGVSNLTTEMPSGSGDAVYTVRITNIGETLDTITLTTSGDIEATLSKTSVTLAAGASTNVTLTIDGDALSAPGEYEVKVKATSGTDSTKTAEVTTKTTILELYGVTLVGVGDLTTETADVSAGVSYTIRVKNIGETLDTITLTTSGDVAATISRSSVSLAPGASTDVVLTISKNALTEVGKYEVIVTGNFREQIARKTATGYDYQNHNFRTLAWCNVSRCW